MSLKTWSDQLIGKIKSSAFFSGEQPEMQPNLSNGGFGGYHPGKRDPFGTQSLQIGQEDGRQAYTQQNVPHTGWTQTGFQTGYESIPQPDWADPQRMQQNAAWQQPAQAATGWQQPAQGATAWQQPAQGATGWQQPAQGATAWQQPAQAAAAWQQPAQTGTNWQQPAQTAAWGAPPETVRQEGNISYMPGQFVTENGQAYKHVERVAQLVSVAACFRIMEFMRNGETVVVNTEAITNDADVQRCLDMLAGAAFTLGCSLTKITSIKRAYLIAPQSVLVLQDAGIAHMSDYRTLASEEQPAVQQRAVNGGERAWNAAANDRPQGSYMPFGARYSRG